MTRALIGAKTHFSMGESILEPDEIVKAAKESGFECVAVADTNSINVLTMLFDEAKKQEIRVIVGASFYVVDDLNWRKPAKGEKKSSNPFWMPCVYVRNDQGLQDIMELLTLANSEDHFYFRPQIDLSDLIVALRKGNLICTSGSLHSVFSHREHESIIATLKASGIELYAEICPVNSQYFDRVNVLAMQYVERHDGKAIISRPCLFKKGEEELRDIMNCVMDNSTMSSMWRNEACPDYFLPTVEELDEAIGSMKSRLSSDGIDASLVEKCIKRGMSGIDELSAGCTYVWDKMPISLPNMSANPFGELVQLCKQGWSERITKEVLGYQPPAEQLETYRDRLKYELMVLRKMGFENYFLLVREVVTWCKSNGIEVGPGRGSVGGSLVAFLLGITDVDPIRFGLFFERFINPERIDLPDIDLDFMSSRREEVIRHLIETYGEEHVAGITNYGTLASASALRGAGKAWGLSEDDYKCSKLLPKEHGQPVPLEESITAAPEIEAFALAYPHVWQTACKLQGKLRNYGQHAAGVIVAGEPLHKRAVIEYRKESKVVNWDKRVVEDFGLVKLDILGLQTLDLLSLVKRYVKERHGKDINLTQIPLNDPKVLEAFGLGKTTGVFQFESGGMKGLLKALAEGGRLSFEDVAAATALYRPGPMESGLMDKFVQIKQGNDDPSYLHMNMKPALEETYSVIVYQEQVMQLARDLAGFTMAESDHLRKAMGKKDPKKMAEMRDKWVDGCEKHSSLDRAVADRLFTQIEAFAGYAFNKSHSVEYTIISYWSMWAKVYYPAEFFAAALTILGEEKLTALTKDAMTHGVHVVPPDINKSSDRYEIDYDAARGQTVLYAPFQAIKGLSEKAAKAIMDAKKRIGRPFASKAEFVATVDRRSCNVRGQESLDKVGAFASIEAGQLPARHPDRLKDQKMMLPGIIVDSVKADRKIEVTPFVQDELIKLVTEACEGCSKCSLAGTPHPTPRLGKSPRLMIVVDSPNWSECDKLKMGEGEASSYLRDALKKAGLSFKDTYLTSLVKAQKPKGEQLTNEMINGCSGYLDREIELLKPPVILALGSRAARHLVPDLKGGWEELFGQEIYDPKRDTTIVIGLNPMMLYADPTKERLLDKVIEQVKEMVL